MMTNGIMGQNVKSEIYPFKLNKYEYDPIMRGMLPVKLEVNGING